MATPAKQGDVTDPEIEGADEDSSRLGGVKVDLKEEEKKSPPPAGTPNAAAATPPDAADERRWKALESQVAATRRINEDLRRQLQTLNERLPKAGTPAAGTGVQDLPKGTPQATIDQYDQLVADNKWQEAVRLLAREEYKVARQVETAQEQVRTAEQRRLDALERSKQKVETLYPTLHRETGDEAAVETQLFNQAIADLSAHDPQFLHDPYAPELAMHRMEELAREQGVALSKTSKTPVRTVGRAGQTSMPVSRGTGGSTTYQLSREQKEWCDANLSHLPEAERYKHYARFAKMAETGGVEA